MQIDEQLHAMQLFYNAYYVNMVIEPRRVSCKLYHIFCIAWALQSRTAANQMTIATWLRRWDAPWALDLLGIVFEFVVCSHQRGIVVPK